jgi:hypothetical protein
MLRDLIPMRAKAFETQFECGQQLASSLRFHTALGEPLHMPLLPLNKPLSLGYMPIGDLQILVPNHVELSLVPTLSASCDLDIRINALDFRPSP